MNDKPYHHLLEDFEDACRQLTALERHNKQLEQECDQLKVALEIVTNELESWKATEEDPDSIRAIQIGKQAIRDSKGLSLAEHDAEVIDETINYMHQYYPQLCVDGVFTSGWLKALRKRANQLRQKEQEY